MRTLAVAGALLMVASTVAAHVLPPLQKGVLRKGAARDEPVATRTRRGCPMSPYATFLTNEQQHVLHELIVEARAGGADEAAVKAHMERYISEVLPPTRYTEFRRENEKFEAVRQRGKREATQDPAVGGEKRRPKRVFDLVDFYANAEGNEFAKFYSDVTKKRMRQLN